MSPEPPKDERFIHINYKWYESTGNWYTELDLYLKSPAYEDWVEEEIKQVDEEETDEEPTLSPHELMDEIFNSKTSTIKNRSQLAKFVFTRQDDLGLVRKNINGVRGEINRAYNRGYLEPGLEKVLRIVHAFSVFKPDLSVSDYLKRAQEILQGKSIKEIPEKKLKKIVRVKKTRKKELINAEQEQELIDEGLDDMERWKGVTGDVDIVDTISEDHGFYYFTKRNGYTREYPFPKVIISKYYRGGVLL